MDRRAFVGIVGGCILAVPLTAAAEQPAMPVIGYINQRSPTDAASIVAAFRQGLKEEGFVEGHNVAIEYRFARGANRSRAGVGE